MKTPTSHTAGSIWADQEYGSRGFKNDDEFVTLADHEAALAALRAELIDLQLAKLEALLPPHKAGLTLDHNPHQVCYDTVEDYVGRMGSFDWVDDVAEAVSFHTNELWVLHWYPDTPVGYNCVCAHTLDALLRHVGGLK